MILQKYDELNKWMKDYPNIGSWLYFNVTDLEVDNNSLNSVSGARYLEDNIDGSKECELLFAVDMIKSYDTGTADTNLEALQECESLMNWVEEQMENENLPQFKKCNVHEVEILDSTPSLSVDTDQQLAKYQIQGRVRYLELKGEQ